MHKKGLIEPYRPKKAKQAHKWNYLLVHEQTRRRSMVDCFKIMVGRGGENCLWQLNQLNSENQQFQVWTGVDGFGKRRRSTIHLEGITINMPMVI